MTRAETQRRYIDKNPEYWKKYWANYYAQHKAEYVVYTKRASTKLHESKQYLKEKYGENWREVMRNFFGVLDESAK